MLASIAGATGCGGSKATAVPVSQVSSHLEEAETHTRERRYDRARKSYESAIESAPDDLNRAFAAHQFAGAMAFWGEVPAAVGLLEKAVTWDPTLVRAWHNLGILRAKLGNDQSARLALDRAVDLAPNDPRPRIARAALFVRAGALESALADYRALEKLVLPERTRLAVGKAIKLLEDSKRH